MTAPPALNKRARPISSLIFDSSSKLNKNTEGSDSSEDEGVEEEHNDSVLSENIMFAIVENQVQAHKDFMKFAKVQTQNTSTLTENLGILIRTQEKVIN